MHRARQDRSRVEVSPAAVLPAPPPGTPWPVKILWYIASTVGTTALWQAWDYAAEITAASEVETDPDPTEWRRLVLLFDNLNSPEGADNQAITLDVVNKTGDLPDSTWTDADYTACKNAIDTNLITAIMPYVPPNLLYAGFNAYIMSYAPYPPPELVPPPALDDPDWGPFTKSGPPEAIKSSSIPGSGTGFTPLQVSSTITEKVPSRRHWGRIYLPSLAGNAYNAYGRLTPTAVNAFAQAGANLHTALAAAGFYVVIPLTQVDKVRKRVLTTVEGIRVDDVPDVQRRRRPKTKSTVVNLPAGAMTKPAESEIPEFLLDTP